MSDSFDIENERIEIMDDDGQSVVFRPMAIIGSGEEIYYVFGSVKDDEEHHQRQLRIILAQREESDDGRSRFVLCESEQEVEQIIASFIKQTIEEAAKEKKGLRRIKGAKKPSSCKEEHSFFEFCYCGQSEYLQ